MDKRLMKRHKRQVLRGRQKIRLSEPDLRTPEQVRAAREASRPGGVRGILAPYTVPSHSVEAEIDAS